MSLLYRIPYENSRLPLANLVSWKRALNRQIKLIENTQLCEISHCIETVFDIFHSSNSFYT